MHVTSPKGFSAHTQLLGFLAQNCLSQCHPVPSTTQEVGLGGSAVPRTRERYILRGVTHLEDMVPG